MQLAMLENLPRCEGHFRRILRHRPPAPLRIQWRAGMLPQALTSPHLATFSHRNTCRCRRPTRFRFPNQPVPFRELDCGPSTGRQSVIHKLVGQSIAVGGVISVRPHEELGTLRTKQGGMLSGVSSSSSSLSSSDSVIGDMEVACYRRLSLGSVSGMSAFESFDRRAAQ